MAGLVAFFTQHTDFMPFGLEVCFDQKQLRGDQPLREHGQQTHARCGEGGCYPQKDHAAWGRIIRSRNSIRPRSGTNLREAVMGAEFGASKADL